MSYRDTNTHETYQEWAERMAERIQDLELAAQYEALATFSPITVRNLGADVADPFDMPEERN